MKNVEKNDGEDIVISGISGRFPESDSIAEFSRNLFNGVDMISDDERRWPRDVYGVSTKSGKLKELSRFDASFFGVHSKQSQKMDPQLRLLLEVTYETIFDAGINPVDLRGSATGVYIGVSGSEAKTAFANDMSKVTGYELTGCSLAMMANRLSYAFDLRGESLSLDTACSSSLVGIQLAQRAIESGAIDTAIVGAVQLCLDPAVTLECFRMSMLSPEGRCKVFDAEANGYVRSEAAVVIILQRRKNALRPYLSVVNIAVSQDGFKSEGVTFPSGEMQKKLLQKVYAEAGIDPTTVSYVEAHGTGTAVGDPTELSALSDVFCKEKCQDDLQQPLLVGSVKSNIGHAEPVAGLCAVAKVICMVIEGMIPANLHFNKPNPNIPAFIEGKVKVVTRNMPWEGELVGLSSFGFGGSNAHVILKCNRVTKNIQNFPYQVIIPFSGRTREAVEFALNKLTLDPKKYEKVIPLLQRIFRSTISGHSFRGFALQERSRSPGLGHLEIQQSSNSSTKDKQRPVWFVFSGVGSQFIGMGRDMLKVKRFKESILRSGQILRSNNTGIDLLGILTKETSLNVLSSALAIVTIQIAIVDLLRSLGVTPKGGIVGHSLGEITCAFVDNCLTLEETLMTVYHRGKILEENSKSDNNTRESGSMASVGLTWEEAKNRCPTSVIYPACHNARDNVTVSGPKDEINKFIEILTTDGVFARAIDTSGQAYHSPYMGHQGSLLKDQLNEIIKVPKQRSSKWISSTCPTMSPKSKQLTFNPGFASPDFFAHNLVSPVFFYEATSQISANSVVLEIAPHAVLQAVLKRTLPDSCTLIGLNHRNSADNLFQFCKGLGLLHNAGLDLDLTNFYGDLSFPLSPTTPSISPLVQWDHSQSHPVPNHQDFGHRNGPGSGFRDNLVEKNIFKISLDNPAHEFYDGHRIDGTLVFPGTGYLVLVWEYFARLQNCDLSNLAVTFENVRFHRATVLTSAGLQFRINLLPGSGQFEVTEGDTVVVSGRVRQLQKVDDDLSDSERSTNTGQTIDLDSSEVYKELRLRGYHFAGLFQGIQRVSVNDHDLNCNKSEGQVKGQVQVDRRVEATLLWRENWVSFLDTFLQFTNFGNIVTDFNSRMGLPLQLDRVDIDPVKFLTRVDPKSNAVDAFYDKKTDSIRCPGIAIQGFHVTWAQRRQQQGSTPVRLESYDFVPFFDQIPVNSFDEALRFCVDLTIENTARLYYDHDFRFNVTEIGSTLPKDDQSAPSWLTIPISEIIDGQQVSGGQFNICVVNSTIGDQFSNNGSESVDDVPKLIAPSSKVNIIKNSSWEVTVKFLQDQKSHFNVVHNDLSPYFDRIVDNLAEGTFILFLGHRGPWTDQNSNFDSSLTLVACKKVTGEENDLAFFLYRKIAPTSTVDPGHEVNKPIQDETCRKSSTNIIVRVNGEDSSFSWVEDLKAAAKKAKELENKLNLTQVKVLLVPVLPKNQDGASDLKSGLCGLFNCLKKEPGNMDRFRCFFPINTKRAFDGSPSFANMNFDLPDENLGNVLKQDLAINIFDEETQLWGTFRHRPLPELSSSRDSQIDQTGTFFDPEKVYIIVGGLGGFGFHGLAGWLIEKGARKLILVSRSGIKNGHQHLNISNWRTLGVNVIISNADLSDPTDCRNFLQEIVKESSCIGGIFNLAMVLKDSLLENQTAETFQTVCKPKIRITHNLDLLTRELKINLDFFIVFSSISCGWGNRGQTSYGYANSVAEQICRQRNRDGLFGALAIQWGAIADVGVLAKLDTETAIAVSHTQPQSLLSCLHTLEKFLQRVKVTRSGRVEGSNSKVNNFPSVVSSMVPAPKKVADSGNDGTLASKTQDYSLLEKVTKLLGLQVGPGDLSEWVNRQSHQTLEEMGLMDSLIAAEIRQLLQFHLKRPVTLSEVKQLTLVKLKELDTDQPIVDPKREKSKVIVENSEKRNPEPKIGPKVKVEDQKQTKATPGKKLQRVNPTFAGSSHNKTKKENFQPGLPGTSQSIRKIQEILWYPVGLLVLTLVFGAFLLSQGLRLLIRPILRLFYSSDFRLMDRPLESGFAASTRSPNIVLVLRCQGSPDRKKLLQLFKYRVFKDSDENNLLLYTITHNYLFYCWRRTDQFRIEDHFEFDLGLQKGHEEGQAGCEDEDLETAAKNAAQFCLNHQWDENKPRWKIRVVSRPKTPGFFNLNLIFHHSYGDGMAISTLVQNCLVDRPKTSTLQQNGSKSSNLTPMSNEKTEFWRKVPKKAHFLTSPNLNQLSKILKIIWNLFIITPHLIVQEAIHFHLDRKLCPGTGHKGQNRSKLPVENKLFASTLVMKLKDLTSVTMTKSNDVSHSGSRNFSVTLKVKVPYQILVLTIMSRVYSRIISEAYSRDDKTKSQRSCLVARVPYDTSSDTLTPESPGFFVNNFAHAWFTIPLPGTKNSEVYQMQAKELLEEIQKQLDHAKRSDVIQAMWKMSAISSLVVKPLVPLVRWFLPKFSVVFTTVPCHLPKGCTILGGVKVTAGCGFSPLGHGGHTCLASFITDDKAFMSLVVNERILEELPNFHEKFFPIFQEELGLLKNELR